MLFIVTHLMCGVERAHDEDDTKNYELAASLWSQARGAACVVRRLPRPPAAPPVRERTGVRKIAASAGFVIRSLQHHGEESGPSAPGGTRSSISRAQAFTSACAIQAVSRTRFERKLAISWRTNCSMSGCSDTTV